MSERDWTPGWSRRRLAVWAGAFVATGSPPGRSAGWLVVGSARRCSRRSSPAGAGCAVAPSAGAALLVLLCLVAGCTVGALRLAAVRGSGLAGGGGRPCDGPRDRGGARGPGPHPGAVRGGRARRRPGGRAGPAGPGRGPRAGSLRTRAPTLVLARDRRWLGLLPGQRVALSGRLGPARAGQPVAAVVSVRGPPTLSGVRRWCSGRPVTCGPGCGGPRGCSRRPSAGCCPGWSWATPRGCRPRWSTTSGPRG